MDSCIVRIKLTYSKMKHFSFTINYGTSFIYFGIFCSKSVVLLGLLLVLENNLFSLIWERIFLQIFSGRVHVL